MGVTKESVEATLKEKLNPSRLDVVDASGGCVASFVVEIVSDQFAGKRLLERHRLVNATLVEKMKEIHALFCKDCTKNYYYSPAVEPTPRSQCSSACGINYKQNPAYVKVMS